MSRWSTIFRPVGGAEKPVSTPPTETYSEICSSSITNQTSSRQLLVCLRMLIRRCVYNNIKRERFKRCSQCSCFRVEEDVDAFAAEVSARMTARCTQGSAGPTT
ncbi:hypothetical protein C1H46_015857 [Malus baccata]|uniref:Uncharacterized protein n=1 Tax=Malus baccata TaxID=106549 RepID=A0A540MJI8_MALBA|nr:hypothetical protein C1H46_015857 [Malus baccata]